MKISKVFLFIFYLFFQNSIVNAIEITGIENYYEKYLFDNYFLELNISLENIGNNENISNLITELIYHNHGFNEYAAYIENLFLEDIGTTYFPDIIQEDGSVYIYRSYLSVEYSIEHINDNFIIIRYFEYVYYSGAAHGLYWIHYYIIDLSEKKLLEVNDLIINIPDEILIRKIESRYNIRYYLREYIWPPDSINFIKDGIELYWNIYQITPYSDGVIVIGFSYTDIEQYLTEKGRLMFASIF